MRPTASAPRVGVEERLVAALVEEPAVVTDDGHEDADRRPLREHERAEHAPVQAFCVDGPAQARARLQWILMFPAVSVPLAL